MSGVKGSINGMTCYAAAALVYHCMVDCFDAQWLLQEHPYRL
jgi:hypothetical protein